jgi:hypothetical protein
MKILRVAMSIIAAALVGLSLLFGYFYFNTSSQIAALESSRSSPKILIEHVVPPASPLRLAESKELDHLLFFDGKVEVRARYEFIYEKDSERTNNPFLILYPDKRSMALLPYLPQNGEKGYPSEIYVRNPDDVAQLMFDNQFFSKLKSGTFPSVSGEAVFTIQGYWVGYECDNPAFAARITNVKSVSKKRNYENPSRRTGC